VKNELSFYLFLVEHLQDWRLEYCSVGGVHWECGEAKGELRTYPCGCVGRTLECELSKQISAIQDVLVPQLQENTP